ncbi:unnamed protein product [Trifolium pratense]|uniref:Uncharacterized protein n=1 Tax=Trifolium pratense TaxID=57577 RepID=A0ACB0LQD3_TRIPR|nr:unnamed protein product [Trifolium pratense]
MSSGRKSRGRQKIEMKKITNESSMLVTFSKRRTGLFKKASELSTLCGANVALIIFSPSGKAFSFGHPNVDTVIDRYLSLVPSQNNGDMQFIEADVRELNSQLTRFNNALDIERRRSVELSHMHNMNETQCWLNRPVDEMNFDQLESLKNALENLKKHIAEHPARLVIQGAFTQTMPFFVGDGLSSNMDVHHQPNYQKGQRFPTQPFQDHMLQPYLFDYNNMGGGGYGPFETDSSSNMHVNHQSNHQQDQIFQAQPFQDPILQPYLFDCNNMGGGGYPPFENGSSSNMHVHHQPNHQGQMFAAQPF